MIDGGIAFNNAQLQIILDALKSLKSEGVHWEQVIPIFLSAFLAMVVGICMEFFKSSREKAKAAKARLEREVGQINTVIVGIGYNIETIIHAVFQNILPHYEQTHAAYAALQATPKDNDNIQKFFLSLGQYPALMMTCPEQYIIETDFLDKLAFIVEKDPGLVKQTGWIVSFARILNNAIRDRNKYIELARVAATQSGLNFYQLESILQIQASIADSECVTTLQLLGSLRTTARSLEGLNATYPIPNKKSKLVPPDSLDDAMKKLRNISAGAIQNMPTG